MPRMISTVCALLSLILPFVTARWIGRHHEVALRARGDMGLYKRQYYAGARFTYYAVGLGACGATSQPSDFVVAQDIAQFGSGYPGPNCFRSITIQYGGLTAVATIVDRCEACPPNGGLDFSEGLFQYFAPLSVGVVYGNWWYNDGEQSSSDWTPPSTTWAPPVATSTPDYTPPAPTTSSVPAYTPTTSTQAYTPPPTTSAATSTATTSSTSPTVLSTGWTSGLASQTAGVTPDPGKPENIAAVLQIIVELGELLSLAQKSG